MSNDLDAPIDELGKDLLDRKKLASRIVRTIESVGHEKSVRIGIYGGWGEGKTSVQRMVKDILSDRSNYFMVHFDPWSAQSQSDVWNGLFEAIVIAADKAKIELDWKQKSQKWWSGLSEYRKALSPGEAGGIAAGVVGGSLAALETALAYDAGTIEQLREKLGPNMRVVVLLDDLDRVDPQFVPTLLMAVREVFNIPGFVFLLALDDEVVSKGFGKVHEGWAGDKSFLEKIIDFPFRLPEPSENQKRRFILANAKKSCPFINIEHIIETIDLFPTNPRRSKLILRRLGALQYEIERHDPHEIDVVRIIIALIMKLYSSAYTRELGREGGIIRPSLAVVAAGSEKSEEDKKRRRTEMLVKAKVNEESIEGILENLTDAFQSRGSLNDWSPQLGYQITFDESPHALTWKEWEECLSVWQESDTLSKVEQWLIQHAEKNLDSYDQISAELIVAAVSYRNTRLSNASDVPPVDEFENHLESAELTLSFLSAVFNEGLPRIGAITEPRSQIFSGVLEQACYWSNFQTNPSDAATRSSEKTYLLEFAPKLAEDVGALKVVGLIQPWADHPFDPTTKMKLKREIIATIDKKAAMECVDGFEVANWVQRQYEYKPGMAARFYLLRSISFLWSDEGMRKKLLRIWSKSHENQSVYNNCRAFFKLITDTLRPTNNTNDIEEVKKIIEVPNVLESLWNALCVKQIQNRFIGEIEKLRCELIEAGAKESDLPRPDWLPEGTPIAE